MGNWCTIMSTRQQKSEKSVMKNKQTNTPPPTHTHTNDKDNGLYQGEEFPDGQILVKNIHVTQFKIDVNFECVTFTFLSECGVLVFLYLLLWAYFPTKPPHPPSISASKPREKFIPGAKKLIR